MAIVSTLESLMTHRRPSGSRLALLKSTPPVTMSLPEEEELDEDGEKDEELDEDGEKDEELDEDGEKLEEELGANEDDPEPDW